jgi:hypothetical protein
MEAPVPMDNKSKTLPPYGSMMPPLSHLPPALHGPPPVPHPGVPRIPPPPRDGQPHGLPAPIPHTSAYEQSWRQQPYPLPHYEAAVERRHSTSVANPPPQSQPPPHPPTHIPYPAAPHPSQQQSRELPQLPPGDPYHRPNSLPAPAPPSHPVPEDLSPRGHYRHMNGTQPEPTPHSAPPPDYRPPRTPFTGPPESPIPGTANGDFLGPPGYAPNVPPPYHGQPTPAAFEGGNFPYARQRKAARAQQVCIL